MAISMDDIVKHIRDLPSLPAVVIELLSSMEAADLDVHVLGVKIASDQSLAAKTLRLANSSFYGVASQVTTIDRAIAVLGFQCIRTLVTACAVTDSFPSEGDGNFNFKRFWRHSVATATCARLLAVHSKLNPDTAFTAGLLHDIGSLVLVTRFPKEYAQVLAQQREQDCFLGEAELSVFGTDHGAVGSALARYWKFPEEMQDAVARHHDDAGPLSLPLVVHAANIIAHALDLSDDPDDLVPAMSVEVWDALALGDADWTRLFRDTEKNCADMCQILVS